jgi:hypothetical protein
MRYNQVVPGAVPSAIDATQSAQRIAPATVSADLAEDAIGLGPDLFGAHEKWSEQSMELARWVAPAFVIAGAVCGAAVFGLGFEADEPPILGIMGTCCLLFALGWALYTLAGGPMRIEVDQAKKTVKWMHARRLRPTEQSWHFDQIAEFSCLLSRDHYRGFRDSSGSDRLPANFDSYYLVMHLTDGSEQRLFGKNFKLSNRSSRADEWMAKMVQLTGRPQRPVGSREDVDQMRARMDAALRRHD